MKPIHGVIFDIDGTLLDSNEAHARAWKAALEGKGYDVKLDSIRQAIGMGSDQLLPSLIGVPGDSPEGESLSEAKKKIFQEKYFDTLVPFPEARSLVKELADRGFRLTVATSSSGEELQNFLRRIGVEDLLRSKTSADDAERSKPAPDLIEAALKKLDLSPEEVVMIGDTPYDIAAAKKAGVATVALRSGGWSDRDLADASEIYDDAEDLLERLDDSSFFAKESFRKAAIRDDARNSQTL